MKKDNQLDNQLISENLTLTWKEKKAIIMAMYSTVLPIATIFFVVYFLAFLLIDYLWL